jgi:hypothetical protein
MRHLLANYTSRFVLFTAVSLLVARPLMSQPQDVKPHEARPEEAKVLSLAASSPEFNFAQGPSLRGELLRSEDHSTAVHSAIGLQVGTPDPDLRPPYERIRPSACAAELIAIGRVVGLTSSLNRNETRVLTLYNFHITAVYKGGEHLLTGTTISVVQLGGDLAIPEGTIRDEDESSPPLRTGEPYVLLLRAINNATGYETVATAPSFHLTPTSLTDGRLKPLLASQEKFESLAQFRDALANSLSTCGGRSRRSEPRI